MFKMKEVPKHVFMKEDKPSEGHLFITHRGGNDHQTPYLIFRNDGKYQLLNLHSHRANYNGETVEELIENYLSRNKSGINPITHYFFSRRWHSDIRVEDTFGWKETGFKKTSPKELMEMARRVTDPKEVKEILDKAVDKSKE
jgi:hypothetical protein